MKPFFVGLSGISGAGKSTVADYLESQGGVKRFRFDAYYKNEAGCPKLPNGNPHWDLPESLHLDQVHNALQELSKGHEILLPVYDRSKNDIVGHALFQPAPVILVEGLQLFSDEKLRDFFDLRMWLEVPEETALARRLMRQPDYNVDYHRTHAIPAHRKHVVPHMIHAHVVLDGLLSEGDIARAIDEAIHKAMGV